MSSALLVGGHEYEPFMFYMRDVEGVGLRGVTLGCADVLAGRLSSAVFWATWVEGRRRWWSDAVLIRRVVSGHYFGLASVANGVESQVGVADPSWPTEPVRPAALAVYRRLSLAWPAGQYRDMLVVQAGSARQQRERVRVKSPPQRMMYYKLWGETPPPMYKSVAAEHGTVVVDEADVPY